MSGSEGGDTINVSGDTINVSGDGGNDTVGCGGNDEDTDTVTKDAGDSILGNLCDGDTIINVP